MKSYALYKRLLGYSLPYIKALLLSIFLLALLALSEPLFPALMKPLLDEGFANKNEEIITWIPLLVIGLFFLRGAIGFLSTYTSSWVSNKIITDIRADLFSHLLRLPISYFDDNSSGKIASYLTNTPFAVTSAATQALTVIVRDSLTIISLTAWLLWIEWKLTLIIFAIFPLIALTVRYFNARLRLASRRNQDAIAQISSQAEETASNIKIIRLFEGAATEKEKFSVANHSQRSYAMKASVAESAVTPIVQVFAAIAVSLIIFLLMRPSSASATAGDFVSYLTALLMLLPSIKRLTDVTSTIQRGLAASDIIFSFLDIQSDISNQEKKKTTPVDAPIILENVNFSYKNNRVLNNVSITIERNKTTALVGKSGSGKSTIISLILGLYKTGTGTIRFDRSDIDLLSSSQLHESIAYVSQDVRLFNDTVENNVAYPDMTPDRKRVTQALKNANALEFVNALSNGKDTYIGQNGSRLSGGQKQRVSIARAFYKNSPILILDEATSALDNQSEGLVQDAIKKLMQNKTCIVIAHRLSTIENADRIYVLDNGEVVESGTHMELIGKKGQYSTLYKYQFKD